MSMFPTIDVAGSGLNVDATWLDTIGGNVANAEDAVTPGKPVYRDQELVAVPQSQSFIPGQSGAGLGVQVQEIALGSAKGDTVSDPENPAANAKGMVTYPDVSVSHETVSLVEAQTSYQANASVLQNADTAYKAILAIKD